MERDVMYGLAVVFFYNTIREWVSNIIGGFLKGLTVSVDIILAILGYLIYKRYTMYRWLGLGLLFGAVASIGSHGIGEIFAPKTTPVTIKYAGRKIIV